MRRALGIALAFATLGGCHKPLPDAPQVTKAWVRLAAVPGRPAAAYFTLTGGIDPTRLIAVESAKVANIELHGMGMAGGMMTMPRLDGVDVDAGSEVTFAPGGRHAMLFGIDPAIKPGDTLPLSFRFAKGRPFAADAKVVAAGDAAPWSRSPPRSSVTRSIMGGCACTAASGGLSSRGATSWRRTETSGSTLRARTGATTSPPPSRGCKGSSSTRRPTSGRRSAAAAGSCR